MYNIHNMNYTQLFEGLNKVGPDVTNIILEMHREAHDWKRWKECMVNVNEELDDVMSVNEGDGRGYKLIERNGVAVGVRFMMFEFGPCGGWQNWGTRDHIFTELDPNDNLHDRSRPAYSVPPTLCIYEFRHGADMSLSWS